MGRAPARTRRLRALAGRALPAVAALLGWPAPALAAEPPAASQPNPNPGPADPAASVAPTDPPPTPAPAPAEPAPTETPAQAPPAEGQAPAAQPQPAIPTSAKPAAPRTSKDALPGSPQAIGYGLSPEAPKAGPAPGGRAPSFGSPSDPDVWSFRWGGKLSGYLATGFNERPGEEQPGQSSLVLHTPPRISGREPFGTGASLTLNFAYGTPVVSAFVNYTVNSTGREHEGWYQATKGAAANSAYIGITPPAFGNLRLQVKVGAISDPYGGTGQWGWGILGPLLATRGYGETIIAEYDLTADWRLFLSHGIAGVPAVSEFFVRGVTTGWNETGVSSFVQHGHLGISYQNRFNARVHVANAAGTDERKFLAPLDPTIDPLDAPSMPLACGDAPAARTVGTTIYCPAPRDGRMDVVALETHTYLNQYGHFGLAGAYYNLVTAVSVHDSIWWTIDWTQGARETIEKYVGRLSSGTGEVGAISAQYDFSLASLRWHPTYFDGRGADVRVSVAGLYHWTIDTDDLDPRTKESDGYLLGLDIDYRMLPWLSATLRAYGTSRDSYAYLNNVTNDQNQQPDPTLNVYGRYETFSVTPGLAFRSDWQAPETIEIAYSRRFYNDFVDANPAAPLDQDIVTVGAQVSF